MQTRVHTAGGRACQPLQRLGSGGLPPRCPALRVAAKAGKESKTATEAVTGIVFRPFDEVKLQLKETTETRGGLNDPTASLVRMHYSPRAEAAVNEQINVELNISYVYTAMAAYFDRDNVALPGFARYFRDQAAEERSHAQKLIDFQNTRGGRVKLAPLGAPESEFYEAERGDALFALELALSLERLNYDKLMGLWGVLDKEADPQAVHFVEYMLEEQADDVKKAADYVSQLRRVGKGHGVWHLDHELYEGEVRYMANAGGSGDGA